jgi:hypothetical protein
MKTGKQILRAWKTGCGMSFSTIERTLELPVGTLDGWLKSYKSIPAGGVALLRIIDTYPWMIEVALKNYDPIEANRHHAIAAINALADTEKSEAKNASKV